MARRARRAAGRLIETTTDEATDWIACEQRELR